MAKSTIYRILRISAVFAASAVLILSFQNCGAGFQAVQKQNAASTSNDVQDPDPLNPSIPAGYVPVFVAQGHLGRTLLSCDDGKSWMHDVSDNSNAICDNPLDPNYIDCANQPNAANNLDFDGGFFFASLGTNAGGEIRKSFDGMTWNSVASGPPVAGVSYFQSTLNWFNPNYQISTDFGATFRNNRAAVPFTFLAKTSTRFQNVLIVSGDDPDAIVSTDNGLSWKRPVLNGVAWGSDVHLSRGLGKLVTVSTNVVGGRTQGYVAYSTDNGATWTGNLIYNGTGGHWSNLFFEGTKFVSWLNNTKYESSDGTSWIPTAVRTAGNVVSGGVARGPTGTYVSISTDAYAKQKAYRSADGITWTALDPGKFVGGHPILNVIAGYVESKNCP